MKCASVLHRMMNNTLGIFVSSGVSFKIRKTHPVQAGLSSVRVETADVRSVLSGQGSVHLVSEVLRGMAFNPAL